MPRMGSRKKAGGLTIAFGLFVWALDLPGRWDATKALWRSVHGAWWLSPLIIVIGFTVFEWEKIEPHVHEWIPAKFHKGWRHRELSSNLRADEPMIVPEPGWDYFHWDELVYQDRPILLRNLGGGDAKDIHIAEMSNRFGRATFTAVGFIASKDAHATLPSVDNFDSAPMIKLRDVAHLVDAEFSPLGQKEGSLKIVIKYKDVKENEFLTTGRLVREKTTLHHQFKDLKFRRVT